MGREGMQRPHLVEPLIAPFDSRYHTGSLAFGSLILAIVQIIRVVLEYLDQRLKGTALPVASARAWA